VGMKLMKVSLVLHDVMLVRLYAYIAYIQIVFYLFVPVQPYRESNST